MGKSRSRSSSSSFGSLVSGSSRKSKLILGGMSALGASFVGLDRLYMGCRFSGFLKLSLFLFMMIVAILNENGKVSNTEVRKWAYNTFFILMIWTFFDLFVILFNLISGQQTAPYTYMCSPMAASNPWKSSQDIQYGRYLGAVIVITNVIIGYTVYSRIFTYISNLLN